MAFSSLQIRPLIWLRGVELFAMASVPSTCAVIHIYLCLGRPIHQNAQTLGRWQRPRSHGKRSFREHGYVSWSLPTLKKRTQSISVKPLLGPISGKRRRTRSHQRGFRLFRFASATIVRWEKLRCHELMRIELRSRHLPCRRPELYRQLRHHLSLY
ncbi:MAG: hypothetical protein JW384_01127 [Nitrosomonadaceae bacterium]|nr:hypothetical protein [Nitrosomonadaceae bacterium]